MKIGDYVRTKYGKIFKWNNLCTIDKKDYEEHTRKILFIEDEIKSSPNIIDLIEEHDLLKLYDREYEEEYIAEVVVDNENILSVCNYECANLLTLEYELMTNEHIKLISIVTREQFSQMEYKVGD